MVTGAPDPLACDPSRTGASFEVIGAPDPLLKSVLQWHSHRHRSPDPLGSPDGDRRARAPDPPMVIGVHMTGAHMTGVHMIGAHMIGTPESLPRSVLHQCNSHNDFLSRGHLRGPWAPPLRVFEISAVLDQVSPCYCRGRYQPARRGRISGVGIKDPSGPSLPHTHS